jgi:hypothetical protein
VKDALGPFDPAMAGTLELIIVNRLTLAELKHRHVVRSGNLVGDFGEYLAAALYGVVLSRKGEAGFDLIDKEGRRVQVKTRAAEDKLSGRKYNGVGKEGYDVCLFLCVEVTSFRPHLAREVHVSRLAQLVDSDGAVTYSKIKDEGIDLLDAAVAVYEAATVH